MITKYDQLIILFCAVCDRYNSAITAICQRFSNNRRPKFTDEECIAIYLFGIIEGKFTQKSIWQFIKYYWADCFPHLPCYEKFNKRIKKVVSHKDEQ